MLKTKRPIRITVSTHGGMLREKRSVGFYIPENMRVAVYTPPFCSVGRHGANHAQNLTLKNAHKIYEPGTRMPEMNLMLMHTANSEERFAVQERKHFHHYITANGQPLRTEHFPELKRYKTHAFNKLPNKIAYRDVTLSQFLSMIWNRYGEERMITIKIFACRSDTKNEFGITYLPLRKQTMLRMKYWNDNNENDEFEQQRVLKRMKRSRNQEDIDFAKQVETQLAQNGTNKNRIRKELTRIYKKTNKGNEAFEEWMNDFGKRRPNYNN
jgi:hypothetical protein